MQIDILGVKDLKRRVERLEKMLDDAQDKLVEAEEQIENLTENVASLERINLYGRGDEPEVIVENDDHWLICDLLMRLYIDGEEFTIKNPDGLYSTYIHPIIKKSIMINGDIATVVIQQYKDYEHIYHIEYDKGTYVHQIRRRENE